LITLASLARICRKSGDTTLPAAVGKILGQSAEEVEKLFKSLTESAEPPPKEPSP